MSERRYVMTRLGPGDYLLPSNDGTTLWRIRRYREDGSLEEDGRPVVGARWSLSQWIGTGTHAAIDNPEEWREWWLGYRTRSAAVRDALRA